MEKSTMTIVQLILGVDFSSAQNRLKLEDSSVIAHPLITLGLDFPILNCWIIISNWQFNFCFKRNILIEWKVDAKSMWKYVLKNKNNRKIKNKTRWKSSVNMNLITKSLIVLTKYSSKRHSSQTPNDWLRNHA